MSIDLLHFPFGGLLSVPSILLGGAASFSLGLAAIDHESTWYALGSIALTVGGVVGGLMQRYFDGQSKLNYAELRSAVEKLQSKDDQLQAKEDQLQAKKEIIDSLVDKVDVLTETVEGLKKLHDEDVRKIKAYQTKIETKVEDNAGKIGQLSIEMHKTGLTPDPDALP